MTWLWQPLLPGAAQLLAGGGSASGAGASAGTATAAATGQSTARASSTVAGTSTVAATGRSTAAGVGNAAGTSTAAATGTFTGEVQAVGSAAGTSTASAVGTSTGGETLALGPGWGERTYRLEWRDRKWVKRKEREDELSNLIRQVYARLSGETETAEAEPVEAAAAEVAEVLAPYTVEESIDWEGLEANARAIADLEDALEAYIKARDEEEDFLLLMAA